MATLPPMFDVAAAIFAVLLVATGLVKVRRPEPTSRAMADLGLPYRPGLGRLLGIVEVGTGTVALAVGGSVVWGMQALLYLAFAVWVAAALRSGTSIASCGCLGSPDTPPYWGHVAVDIIAVIASAGAAIAGTASPLVGGFGETLTTVLLAGIGAFLAWVAIGDAARVAGMARS
jgi:hypothetical protein